MPDFLTLRGRNALSEFRLKKLTQALKRTAPAIAAITAEYWHFVALKVPLQPPQRKVLERILTYGPSPAGVAETGRLLLVVPRLGTISPWASKATDIAHSCGLDSVERIERGVAYYIRAKQGGRLDAVAAGGAVAADPRSHDRDRAGFTRRCVAAVPACFPQATGDDRPAVRGPWSARTRQSGHGTGAV